MTHFPFLKEWEQALGRKLHFRINDNHSTMLSVRRERDCIRVSMHRMFLDAPSEVLEALQSYLRTRRKQLPFPIRSYIEQNMQQLDYSNKIPGTRLVVKGQAYNLQDLYDEINAHYFQGQVSLRITWFGRRESKNRSSMTFGLYYAPLRLIKIHRKLDSPQVPEYVVAFIIYHEMVHHVCPAYFDEGQVHRIHTKEFREKERQFAEFEQAQAWIKENQDQFFEPQSFWSKIIHGRT